MHHWVPLGAAGVHDGAQVARLHAQAKAGCTFGSPVVPLVYMMVHRSLGAGGDGSAGLAAPSSRNAAHVCAVTPASLHACSHWSGFRIRVRH